MALPKIDVPRYPVVLPSTGESYTMRPYLVKEEKVLLLAMESQDPAQIALAVRNLITGCIDDDLNLDECPSFDIEKLFLELRGISVGETIPLTPKCQDEGCEEAHPIEINIKDITLKDYDPDAHIIHLTDSVGVTMRYPSLDLINSVGLDKFDSIDGIMDLIVGCVKTIFDNDNVYDANNESKQEITDFLESLTSDQFGHIQKFFTDTPALEYNLEWDCKKCEHHNNIELRGLSSFFI
jgi:hypothetical protein